MFIKLISLNTWGGRVGEPLLEFFRRHQGIDIFCLQEVFSRSKNPEIAENLEPEVIGDLYQRLEELLPEHQLSFLPITGDFYGLACAVKRNLAISNKGLVVLHRGQENPDLKKGTDHDRKMQWLEVVKNGHHYCIMNAHGLWTKHKLDNQDRLWQSKQIIDFLRHSDRHIKKALVGDFNLLPETESIGMIEKYFINLIKTNRVKSTRTSFCKLKDRLADYVFVSPDVNVVDFAVLPNEVSDHNALYVEFN